MAPGSPIPGDRRSRIFLGGYVTEIPYLRDFKQRLARARLDHAALIYGVGSLDPEVEIRWLVLPCGATLEADSGLLRLERDGITIADDRHPGWRGFLVSLSLFAQ